ncbi:MAG: aminotransferase class IV [Flavobacteriaceae bacterium]|jgi:branched-chain amino acid aminotransferase|nr:aminotransferase class IV [Flavobacteriaceae bacterium]
MVNKNGNIYDNNIDHISIQNSSILTGDFIYENVIMNNNSIFFFEDHYFNIVSTMRIVKMKIPTNFTQEFLEKNLFELYSSTDYNSEKIIVKILISRNNHINNESIEFYMYDVNKFDITNNNSNNDYILDVFKDYYKNIGLLSNLNLNNQSLRYIGRKYASENDFDDCVVLNINKTVCESLNGTIFRLCNNTVFTPPLSDGCIGSVYRTKVIKLINDLDNFEIIEEPISVFDLQKSDELFIFNINDGIQAVSKFRKKEFSKNISKLLNNKLSDLVK